MNKINKQILIDRIKEEKRMLEKFKKIWEKIPPERKPYHDMALCNMSIAISNLLLGNKQEALIWFKESTENYSRSRKKGEDGEVQTAMWILLMSVLSKDRDLIQKNADIVDDLGYKRPIYGYKFLSCLSNIIRKKDSEALVNAEELGTLEPIYYSRMKYYKGLGETCKGLLKKDSKLFKEGIEKILKRHKTLIPSLGDKTDDALVCIPAIVLLLLAKERGITIKKEEIDEKFRDYIPWILLEGE